MAFTDQEPDQTRLEPQARLGSMLDGAHADLGILATLSRHKSYGELDSGEDFAENFSRLRYRHYPGRLSQIINGKPHQKFGFIMDANQLEVYGVGDWHASLFSPYDAFPPDGSRAAGRYLMNIVHKDAKSTMLDQVVAVDCSEGIDDTGPRLRYWTSQGITTREIVVDNLEMEASYPFHVVTQITDQLRREANALLALALDGVQA